MFVGAISIAEKARQLQEVPDLILATDMLDLAGFRGQMGPVQAGVPTILYFHENQISYPWSA